MNTREGHAWCRGVLTLSLLLFSTCSENEISIHGYPAAKAAAVCRQLFDCCDLAQLQELGRDYSTEHACRDDVSAFYNEAMTEIFQALELDELSFDGKLADEMLTALAKAGCSVKLEDLGYVETEIITPRTPVGQPCHSILSCIGSRCISTDPNSSLGTCMAHVPVGGVCEDSNDCEMDLYCHKDDSADEQGICAEGQPQGSACQLTEECAPELACLQQSCQPRRAEGESCQRYDDCREDLLCAGGLCRLPFRIGEECRDDFQCEGDLICSHATYTCATPCSLMESEAGCDSAGRGNGLSFLLVVMLGGLLSLIVRRTPASQV